MRYLTTVVLLVLLATTVCCNEEGYYWREYLGLVPPDALVIGQDKSGNDVHVGQAYIKGAGLIVGRVVSGEKYMFAPYGGIIIVGKFVKVLCGSPENFYWVKANSSNLHSVTIGAGQTPVIGGHEDGANDYLYVGKAIVKDDLKVGKIGPASAENANFYYNNDGFEAKLGSFEVLMYRNSTTNIVERIKAK